MARRLHAVRTAKRPYTSAAAMLLGSLLAFPALGATPHHILCSEADGPTLEVAVESLTAETVSHDLPIASLGASDNNGDDPAGDSDSIIDEVDILEPRAKAAIRQAFSDAVVESDSDDTAEIGDDDATVAPTRIMHTRLPGVSDEKLNQYKRQMFRRDI